MQSLIEKKVYCKYDAYAVQFVVMDLVLNLNYIDCSYVQNHMLDEFFSSMSILCLRGAQQLFLLFFRACIMAFCRSSGPQ